VVFVLLAVRLFGRASDSAVDLLFLDQWDFWQPLFSDAGPSSAFRWQHGPHRQGLGGLVLWFTAQMTGWNVRAEVFVSCAIVVAGAGVLLWFAPRLRSGGRLDRLDAVLPLLLLGGLQADGLTATPNPAHGAVPFALACITPVFFAIDGLVARLVVVSATAVAAMYTGFGFLFAPVLLAVLAIEASRAPSPAIRRAHLAAIALVLAGCATFFVGYVPTAAVDCYRFPDPRPLRYVPFAAIVLLRPLGLDGPHALPIALSVLASIPLASGGLMGSTSYLLRPSGVEARLRLDQATFLLCGFATAFALSTAVGRACLGLEAAAMPRYVPYILPALAMSWLALRDRLADGPTFASTALILAAITVQEVSLELHPLRETEWIASGKRAFRACLVTGEGVAGCAARTGFQIHPSAEAAGLDAKVSFLRSRSLGPFRKP
jgi:hypothetical protein